MNPDLRDDAVLLAVLSIVVDGLDPVPPGAIRAAVAACELRHVDHELASLVADSSVGGQLLRRHESEPTVLTFGGDELMVEVELDGDGYAVGLLSPPTATDVVVEAVLPRSSRTGDTTRSDELGRFHIGLGAGLCRLRIGSGADAVFTAWFYA